MQRNKSENDKRRPTKGKRIDSSELAGTMKKKIMCYKRKPSLCFYYSLIIVLVFLRLELEIPRQALKLCFTTHVAIASGGVRLHCSSVEKGEKKKD